MVKNYFIIFILFYFGLNQLWAAPKKEVLEKYQKELSQVIPFKFTKKPLMEILEDIKKKSEFAIIIDEQSILEETPKIVSKLSPTKSISKSIKNNKDDSGSIDYSLYQFPELSLDFDSITILDALLWLEELTYLDFDVSDKGILISTKDALIKPLVTLKVYDFSMVFFKPQDFYSESILKEDDDTDNYRSNYRSESNNNEKFDETAEDVIDILKENIKDGNWNLKSTNISTNGNMLNVINTPEAHQKIKNMIDNIQSENQKQVVIDFKFIQTPIDALDKFYEDSSKGVFLSKEAYKKLILTDLPSIKEAVEISSSRIVCFNSQNVFTFCGLAKNFLIDYQIIDSTPDPTMRGSFIKGFDFQIQPVVSFDNSQINLNLNSTHILNTEVIKHEYKTQSEKNGGLGVSIMGNLNGKGETEKNETKTNIDIQGNVDSKGELVVHPKIPAKIGEINKLQKSSCKFLQSLILENGSAVILKRSIGKLKENKSYYFILQAQTIELKD